MRKALKRVPMATITRLSSYVRYLGRLSKKRVVTSQEIARETGVSSALVRRDLSYIGKFGTSGVGYEVKELRRLALRALKLARPCPIVVVGAGKLGTALCACWELRGRGFRIVGIFDKDFTKIKKQVFGMEILPLDKLLEITRQYRVKIGILAVPASDIQEAIDFMVKNGVPNLLTFGSTALWVPAGVEIVNVDPVALLEVLTYNLVNKGKYSRKYPGLAATGTSDPLRKAVTKKFPIKYKKAVDIF